jgi:hypothetical protein
VVAPQVNYAQRKANRTTCKYGHPLEGDNVRIIDQVYTNRGGKTYKTRQCLTCYQALLVRLRQRNAA